MAALENGIAAVAASSGQSAQFMAIATIVRPSFLVPKEFSSFTMLFVAARLVQVTTSLRGSYPSQLPYDVTKADFSHSTGLYGGVRGEHLFLRE